MRAYGVRVKFLFYDPLIDPLSNLNLKTIHWVIVGGESNHKPRAMNSDWVLDIQKQCQLTNVVFFFKQWGGKNKKKASGELNGKTNPPQTETAYRFYGNDRR